MSALPPLKSLDGNQISHDDSSTGVNNTNGVNNVTGAANGSTPGATGAQKTGTGSTQMNGMTQGSAQDDPYRYAQQMPAQGQQQQYPYYSYPPVYSQQQQQQQFQNQYPYYQSAGQTATGTPSAQSATTQSATGQVGAQGYDYNNYSRMNYVQNYTPMYQGQMMNGATGAAGAAGVLPQAQPGTQAITASTASGVGQVQPVGSRPRVTTTMWEDEKTLCYQVDANGVSVVRRADNNMINGTKLLNVAHMTRGRRDGILKSEKVRDVVKIGSMHLKGVWIPFERALAMAQREGIVDLLFPLFVRDIKQVIQQGSTTQPQANPAQQWGYQAAAIPAPAPMMQQPQQSQPQHQQQQPQSQQPQQQQQQPQTGSQVAPATGVAQQTTVKTSNSPYMTPTSLSNSTLTDTKPSTSAPQTAQSAPQGNQQSYYGYPYYPQYQYGYGATATGAPGATTSTAATGSAATSATGATSAGQYQYPQYNYGYMPQYPNPTYEEQKDK